MKKEIWKPVVGYEGLYEVSNWGRVKSFDTYRKGSNGSIRIYKGRILKQGTTKYGYKYVVLCKNGKLKNCYVHRLVAQAFLDNPNNLPCVNHKDECKSNNNVVNLEFCTYEYNCNFGTRNERRIKTISKPIVQYDLEGNFIKEWASAMQAEREGGFNSGNICKVCRGKLKKYKDFIWKYK